MQEKRKTEESREKEEKQRGGKEDRNVSFNINQQ